MANAILNFHFDFLHPSLSIPPHICLWTYFRWRREGKQSAQELESASRRPTAVPTTSVVGVRPPRKFSTTRLCSLFIGICCLLVKNCDRALVQFDLAHILESCFSEYYWGRRWQLEYKSEYLLFSSYRQAAWSERMTSRLSILFICCHFLRWKALLCQIPIDRLVCNALEWHWRSVLVERRHFANWPTKQATSCHILGCLFLPPLSA